MQKTSIYYFSGTGNCLSAAKQLQEEIGGEIIVITKELIDSKPLVEGDVCVLIFPAYAYGLPKLVKKFLKTCDFKVDYFAALASAGSSHGGALSMVAGLLKKKKQTLDYAQKVQSVQNYVHIFGFPKDNAVAVRTGRQRTGIKIAAEMIKMRAKAAARGGNPFFSFVSGIFYAGSPLFAASYRALKTCTDCGICERVCPAAAIKMKDGKPKFKAGLCNHCQCCMNLCPNKAIKYMKFKPASPRYIHPDIKIEEFFKR